MPNLMKLFFFISTLFCCVGASAQITQYISAPNTTLENKGKLKINVVQTAAAGDSILTVHGGVVRRSAGLFFYADAPLTGSTVGNLDHVGIDPDFLARINTSLDFTENFSSSLPTDYVTYPALDSALATISASAFWNPYDQSDTLTDFRQVSLNDYQLRIFSSLDPDMASEMFFNYSTHRTRMSAWNNYSGAYTRFEVDPAYTDLYSEGKDADSVLQFSRVALYGGLGIYWQSSDGKYFIENLPVYANDAAAGTAGLEADRVYKTPDGHLMIKLFLPFLLFIKRRRKKTN
jgi:hypothetical protein